MNYQSNVFESLVKEAAEHLNTYPENLEVFAWPQMFGSTAGPNPGFGGCAMTTFTVFGFLDVTGRAILHCGNQWKIVTDFRPLMRWE